MTILKNLAVFSLFSLLAACSSQTTPHTQSAPDADGTLVIREAQVLRLATGGTGQGTLTLHGWQYPFEISNMTLAGVGPGDVQFEGDVFNIANPGDLEGTYQLVAADVDSGKGADGFWFENTNGVRVHIRTEGQDVTIRLDTGGSVVRLK